VAKIVKASEPHHWLRPLLIMPIMPLLSMSGLKREGLYHPRGALQVCGAEKLANGGK